MPKKNDTAQLVTKDYLDKKLDEKIDELAVIVKSGFDELGGRVDRLEVDVTGLKQEVTGLKQEVGQMRALMVDKDYLDRKLAELKWELLAVLRKEDDKFNLLVQILKDNNILKDKDLSRLQEIVIFPVWKKQNAP